jgi:LmbE family N-acetylglucosaminyl deacetylase
MTQKLKLMAILAHPDDESLGFGGTLAKYAAEEVEIHLVTATRGERGRFGSLRKGADPAEVGRVRETELRAAAAVLGIGDVSILGYPDAFVEKLTPLMVNREYNPLAMLHGSHSLYSRYVWRAEWCQGCIVYSGGAYATFFRFAAVLPLTLRAVANQGTAE